VPGGGPPAPPPVSDAWRTATTVRIGLKTEAEELLVSGSIAWRLMRLDSTTVASAGRGAALRIVRSGGKLQISRRDASEPEWKTDDKDTLILAPEGRGLCGWGGRWYRGTFRIFASVKDRPGLTLVNELPLEDYLRGVLPEEIGTPPESDFEAVKAQAVAARSYTLSYIGRRADLGFDIWSTIEDQVYGGTARENIQSNRALQATRGEVLLCENTPIRALYSSACGGRTANVEDVWPWPWTAYLRSVHDGDTLDSSFCMLSANYRWREEWSVDAFMATLRRFAPAEGISDKALEGNLNDIWVESRSRSGRVEELVVSTTTGNCVLRGDRIRWSLRRPGTEAILRSSFFKIGLVRGGNGTPLQVVASGGGNGHGIGMCQWGAMGMARAGKNYRQILRHYYKSTQIAHL
jgi:stage II sporulation protein D